MVHANPRGMLVLIVLISLSILTIAQIQQFPSPFTITYGPNCQNSNSRYCEVQLNFDHTDIDQTLPTPSFQFRPNKRTPSTETGLPDIIIESLRISRTIPTSTIQTPLVYDSNIITTTCPLTKQYVYDDDNTSVTYWYQYDNAFAPEDTESTTVINPFPPQCTITLTKLYPIVDDEYISIDIYYLDNTDTTWKLDSITPINYEPFISTPSTNIVTFDCDNTQDHSCTMSFDIEMMFHNATKYVITYPTILGSIDDENGTDVSAFTCTTDNTDITYIPQFDIIADPTEPNARIVMISPPSTTNIDDNELTATVQFHCTIPLPPITVPTESELPSTPITTTMYSYVYNNEYGLVYPPPNDIAPPPSPPDDGGDEPTPPPDDGEGGSEPSPFSTLATPPIPNTNDIYIHSSSTIEWNEIFQVVPDPIDPTEPSTPVSITSTFTISTPQPCDHGTSCTAIINFNGTYSQVTIPINVFNIVSDVEYECTTSVYSSTIRQYFHTLDITSTANVKVATVKYSGTDIAGSTIITLVDDILQGIGTLPYLSLQCAVTVPIEPNTFVPMSVIDAHFSFIDTTEPQKTLQILTPSISAYSVVHIQPQICKVSAPCTFSFQFSAEFAKTLPALKFTAKFVSAWHQIDRDYCIGAQTGQEIFIQLIQNEKYSSDEFITCSFQTIPLEPTSLSQPLLEFQIYQPIDPVAIITDLLTTPKPIPLYDSTKYLPHPLHSNWAILNTPIFATVNIGEGKLIFGMEIGNDENNNNGDDATINQSDYEAYIENQHQLLHDPNAEPLHGLNRKQIKALRSFLSLNEDGGDGGDAGDDGEEDPTPPGEDDDYIAPDLYVAPSVLSVTSIDGTYFDTIDPESPDNDAGSQSAGIGIYSPILRVAPVSSCLGKVTCAMNYTILVDSHINRVRFTNHFRISDRLAGFECKQPGSNAVMAVVTVSPDLQYLYLTPQYDGSFYRGTCIVDYDYDSIRTARRVVHNYEFNDHPANKADPNETNWSELPLSDWQIYPAFSSHQLTVLKGYVQPYSSQNYLLLDLPLRSGMSIDETLPTRLLYLNITFGPDMSLPNDIDSDVPADGFTIRAGMYDISQIECGIIPLSNQIVQPLCFCTSTPLGIAVEFSKDATTHNVKEFLIGWSLGHVDKGHFLYPNTVESATITIIPTNVQTTTGLTFPVLSAPFTLARGQRFAPVLSQLYDTKSTCETCNIYAPRGQDINLVVDFKDEVLTSGTVVVFQLVAERKGDIDPVPFRFDMITAEANLQSVMPTHFTCTNCVLFKVSPTATITGQVEFTVQYLDNYNSFVDLHRKVNFHIDIQTPQKYNFPSIVGYNNDPLTGEPTLITTFSSVFPQLIVLYDYYVETSTTQVTQSERSGQQIDGVQINEHVVFNFPTQGPIETSLLDVGDVVALKNALRNVKYEFEFEGCFNWGPTDPGTITTTSAYSTCSIPEDDPDHADHIHCHDSNPQRASAVTLFTLKAPNQANPFTRCNFNTVIEGEVRVVAGDGVEADDFAPFKWTFTRRIAVPAVILPGQLTFTRSAVLCFNDQLPSLLAAPGRYTLRTPSGYGLTPIVSDAYEITHVSGNVYNIIVGAKQIGLASTRTTTAEQASYLHSVISIYATITCPDAGIDDVTLTSWVWGYSPLTTAIFAGDHPSNIRTTNNILKPALGYFIMHGTGHVPRDGWTIGAGQFPPYPVTKNKSTGVAFAVFVSLLDGFSFEIVSPNNLKFPVVHRSGKHVKQYNYVTSWIDKSGIVQRDKIRGNPMIMRAHPTNPNIQVVAIFGDVDIFDKRNYQTHRFYEPWQGVPAELPVAGVTFIGFSAVFSGDLGLNQCFRQNCSYLGPFPVHSEQKPIVTFQLPVHLYHTAFASLQVDRQLEIQDKWTITFKDPNTPKLVDNNEEISWFEFQPINYIPPGQFFHVESTIAPNGQQSLSITIIRTIPPNTVIEFPIQCKPLADDAQDNYKRILEYELMLEEELPSDEWMKDPILARENFPATMINVTPELSAFTVTSGVHLHRTMAFSVTLGDETLHPTQVIRINNFPFSPIITPITRTFAISHAQFLQTSAEFTLYTTKVPTTATNNGVALMIELKSSFIIPTQTTLNFEALLAPHITSSNNPSTIPYVELSCPFGIGPKNVVLSPFKVTTNIPILSPYKLELKPQGAPSSGSNPTLPQKWTTSRLPIKPCTTHHDPANVNHNSFCWFTLQFNTETLSVITDPETNIITDVTSTSKSGIALPSAGYEIHIHLDNADTPYTIDWSATSEQTFSTSDSEVYTNPDNTQYTIKRLYESNHHLAFIATPVSTTTPTNLIQITFPIAFSEELLSGLIKVEVLNQDTRAFLFREDIPGPEVFFSQFDPASRTSSSSNISPYDIDFAYIDGGLYVGEPLQIALMGVGVLQATKFDPSEKADARKSLPQLPYFSELKHSYNPSHYSFTSFTEIGLIDIDNALFLNKAITPVTRAFVPNDPTNPIEWVGLCTPETYINPSTSERSFSLNFQALNSFSEGSLYKFDFDLIPDQPMDFGEDVPPAGTEAPTAWSYTTYTNRKFLESPTGTQENPLESNNPIPLINYQGMNKILSVNKNIPGFKVRPKPWIRIIPDLKSIDVTRDLDPLDVYSPPQQYLTLTIRQNWPKREEMTQTAQDQLPTGWTEFRFHTSDIVHIVIPHFYQVAVGKYQCTDSAAQLYWNGIFFELLFNPLGDQTITLDSYSCTFPISVSQKMWSTNSFVSIAKTLSHVIFNTADNSDFHLPVSTSTQPSPLSNAPANKNVESLYLEWFMPVAVSAPLHRFIFENVDTVGKTGQMTLQIENGYVRRNTILSYPLIGFTDDNTNAFPLQLTSMNQLGNQNCTDSAGRLVAIVNLYQESGLTFTFVNTFSTSDVICSTPFTPIAPFAHGGAKIVIDGDIRSTSPSLIDPIKAKTTIEFPSSSAITLPTPELTLEAMFIYSLNTRVTLTGSNFYAPRPAINATDTDIMAVWNNNGFIASEMIPFVEQNLLVNTTSLSVSFGVLFKHHEDTIPTDRPLYCLTESNQPWAVVHYSNYFTDEFSNNEVASMATFTFLTQLSPNQTWSCHIEVTQSTNEIPRRDPASYYNPPNSLSQTVTIDNRMAFTPNISVDLAISRSNEVGNRVGSITAYFNSTTTDLTPLVLEFSLPTPLLTIPKFGCTCYLNNQIHTDVALRLHMSTGPKSTYTLNTSFFTFPAQTGLTRLHCFIPSLSTSTQARTDNNVAALGPIAMNTYTVPWVSSTNLAIASSNPAYPFQIVHPTNMGTGSVIELTAYNPTEVFVIMRGFPTIAPYELKSGNMRAQNPTSWTLTTANICFEYRWDQTRWIRTDNMMLHSAYYGMMSYDSTGPTTERICGLQVTPSQLNFPKVPIQCNPEVDDCFVMSSILVYNGETIRTIPKGGHAHTQLYDVKLKFKPFFRPISKSIHPYNLGTVGYHDWEYSGYDNASSLFIVRARTDSPEFVYALQVTTFIAGKQATALTCNNFAVLSTESTGIHINNPNERDYGCDFKISPGSRWDLLSTLRIAYKGVSISGKFSFEIIRSTAYPPSPSDPVLATFTTRVLTPPPDTALLKPSTYNPLPLQYALPLQPPRPLYQYETPMLRITPPLDKDGNQLPLVRGETHLFSLTITNMATNILTTPEVGWLQIQGDPDLVAGLDHSTTLNSALYHLNTPRGIAQLYGDKPGIAVLSAVVIDCYDYSWNTHRGLLSLGIGVVSGQIGMLVIPLEAVNRRRAEKGILHDTIECQFPISFVAPPDVVKYTSSFASFAQVAPFIPYPFAPSQNHELTRDYLRGHNRMVQYTDPITILSNYTSSKLLYVELDQGLNVAGQISGINIHAHGVRVSRGDVFLLKFKTNTTITPQNEGISSSRDQPFRFTSIPATDPSCYNIFYPWMPSSVGKLIPVDPFTYLPQFGLDSSDTFILQMTLQSVGHVYPQMSCRGMFMATTAVPFNGYIEIQHFSQREYNLITGLGTPALPLHLQSAPVYPSCGGTKDSYEQVRWCPRLGGIIKSDISTDIHVSTSFTPQLRPLEPVQILFNVTYDPIPTDDVILRVDLTKVRFSTFSGCEGFPLASFYGAQNTNLNDQLLQITIPKNMTNDGKTFIRCHFLSSRYIQPEYVANGGPKPLDIPILIDIPNRHFNNTYVTAYNSTFPFISTYDNTTKVIPTITYLIDRPFLYNLDSSNINTGVTIMDPLLNAIEIQKLIQWFSSTSSISLFNSDVEIFRKIDPSSVFVVDQIYSPGGEPITTDESGIVRYTTPLLTVTLGIPSLELSEIPLLYSGPISSPETWLETSRHSTGLKISERMLHRFQVQSEEPGSPDTPMRWGKYLSLRQLTAGGLHVDICAVGGCGANCQGCMVNTSCYNSDDCGYGLYCNLNVDGFVVTSATNQLKNAVVKPGLTRAAGLCTPIQYPFDDKYYKYNERIKKETEEWNKFYNPNAKSSINNVAEVFDTTDTNMASNPIILLSFQTLFLTALLFM